MLFHFLASVIGIEAEERLRRGAGAIPIGLTARPRRVRYAKNSPLPHAVPRRLPASGAGLRWPLRTGWGRPSDVCGPVRRATMSSGVRRTQIFEAVVALVCRQRPTWAQTRMAARLLAEHSAPRPQQGPNPSLRSCRFVVSTGQPVGIPCTAAYRGDPIIGPGLTGLRPQSPRVQAIGDAMVRRLPGKIADEGQHIVSSVRRCQPGGGQRTLCRVAGTAAPQQAERRPSA